MELFGLEPRFWYSIIICFIIAFGSAYYQSNPEQNVLLPRIIKELEEKNEGSFEKLQDQLQKISNQLESPPPLKKPFGKLNIVSLSQPSSSKEKPADNTDACKSRDFGQGSTWESIKLNYQEISSFNTGISKYESNGWFDIPDDQWYMMKELHYINRCDQFSVKTKRGNEYANFNWRPTMICPLPPVRIGKHDGGKVLCPQNLNTDNCLVYSIGSAGNFRFEEEILKWNPNCEIHTFDPDPKYSTVVADDERIKYHSIGLASKDDGNMKKLRTVVEELGHTDRKIDVFKIDCEGCEFAIMSEFADARIELSQVLVEVHGLIGHENWLENMFHSGYVMFSKELNTFGCGAGGCIEFSFLKFNNKTFY